MRIPHYPAPVPADPKHPDTPPPVGAIGNQMIRCANCWLWHEIPTSTQIVRVVCTCGYEVWSCDVLERWGSR